MVEISEITSLEILNRRLAEGKEWVLVNMVQHPDPGAKETKMVYIMARFEPLQP